MPDRGLRPGELGEVRPAAAGRGFSAAEAMLQHLFSATKPRKNGDSTLCAAGHERSLSRKASASL